MNYWEHKTTYALIFANMVPLFGVIFLDFDVYALLVAYWAETAVIGFYTIMKLAYSMGDVNMVQRFVIFPILVLIFLAHFGVFLLFSIEGFTLFFGPVDRESVELPKTAPIIFEHLMIVWPVILAFFVSHGYSFVKNYMQRHEYDVMHINNIMIQPYKRVYTMIIVMILGGALAVLIDQLFAVVLFVLVKIFFDVHVHEKEHKLEV